MQILINLLQTEHASLASQESLAPSALTQSTRGQVQGATTMHVMYEKRRAFHEGVGPRIESVDYFGTREYFSRRKNKESLGEKFRWGEVIG